MLLKTQHGLMSLRVVRNSGHHVLCLLLLVQLLLQLLMQLLLHVHGAVASDQHLGGKL